MKAFLFLIAATLLMCTVTLAVPYPAAHHPPGFGVETTVHYDIVAIDQADAGLSVKNEFVIQIQPICLQLYVTDFNFRTDYWLPPGAVDITCLAPKQNSQCQDKTAVTNRSYITSPPLITSDNSRHKSSRMEAEHPILHIEFG